MIGTYRMEKKNDSSCNLQWHLGTLRGTKLESRDSQLSISKKYSRNRYNWCGIRPDRRKDCNVPSNLATVYIFPRLVTVTHAAGAHLLCQTSSPPFLTVSKRFDSIPSVYKVVTRFLTIHRISPWGGGVLAHFVPVCYPRI